jgi:hypothetical protein
MLWPIIYLEMKSKKTNNNLKTVSVNSEIQRNFTFIELLKKEGTCIITLGDLFEAIENATEISEQVDRIFEKREHIRILIEGSAFEQNMDVLDQVLARRNNPDDSILLIDIREHAVKQHIEHIQRSFPERSYHVIRGDANSIPLPGCSIDLVVNDCTINFNASDKLNEITLSEIKRVLKPVNSLCLFSVAVDRQYDNPEYGQNQELVPLDKQDIQGFFYPLPDLSITLGCWPVPHYKSLFKKAGFQFTEFDIKKGKSYCPAATKISYRRYILKLSS